MFQTRLITQVRRITDTAAVIDVRGEVNLYAENVLLDAYLEASRDGTKAVVLNFAGLEYMNSAGIGLLVTMLIRATRSGQRLLAVHLGEHYREIFTLTRLDEAISIFPTEAEALEHIL